MEENQHPSMEKAWNEIKPKKGISHQITSKRIIAVIIILIVLFSFYSYNLHQSTKFNKYSEVWTNGYPYAHYEKIQWNPSGSDIIVWDSYTRNISRINSQTGEYYPESYNTSYRADFDISPYGFIAVADMERWDDTTLSAYDNKPWGRGIIKILDSETFRTSRTYIKFDSYEYDSDDISSIKWSPNGRLLAWITGTHNLTIRNIADGGIAFELKSRNVWNYDWLADSQHIITSNGSECFVFDINHESNIHTILKFDSYKYPKYSCSPDGNYIAVSTQDDGLMIFDANYNLIHQDTETFKYYYNQDFSQYANIDELSWSYDSKKLTFAANGAVYGINSDDWSLDFYLTGLSSCNSYSWSPYGSITKIGLSNSIFGVYEK